MNKKGTALAQFLKEARSSAKLTQLDVSTHLGYDTPQFISNWERGVSAPPVAIIKKISELYKISAEKLFEIVLNEEIRARTEELRKKFKQAH